jgi:hypothetical protein
LFSSVTRLLITRPFKNEKPKQKSPTILKKKTKTTKFMRGGPFIKLVLLFFLHHAIYIFLTKVCFYLINNFCHFSNPKRKKRVCFVFFYVHYQQPILSENKNEMSKGLK